MRALTAALLALAFAPCVGAKPIIPLLPPSLTPETAPRAAAPGLVKRSKRVKALHAAGLDTDLAAFDELDRDLLVYAAASKTPAELAAKYPALDPAKLKSLQAQLRVAR